MGETSVVNLQKGGKRDNSDLLSLSYSALQGLVAGKGVGTIPFVDAASQNALCSKRFLQMPL